MAIEDNGQFPLAPYRQEGERAAEIDPVIIPCPSCGEKALTVNGAVAKWIQIPESHCDCGFSGPIEWANPRFSTALLAQVG
jgi:hypothetical protein